MKSNILRIINQLEGYKVAIKNLHWSAGNMSEHKLCDDIASGISEYEDKIAEIAQGMYGQIVYNQVKPVRYSIEGTEKMLKSMLKDVARFNQTLNGRYEKGLASETDSFIGEIEKYLYLIRICVKEDFERRIGDRILESRIKRVIREELNLQ